MWIYTQKCIYLRFSPPAAGKFQPIYILCEYIIIYHPGRGVHRPSPCGARRLTPNCLMLSASAVVEFSKEISPAPGGPPTVNLAGARIGVVILLDYTVYRLDSGLRENPHPTLYLFIAKPVCAPIYCSLGGDGISPRGLRRLPRGLRRLPRGLHNIM